jgi:hypothetical protein
MSTILKKRPVQEDADDEGVEAQSTHVVPQTEEEPPMKKGGQVEHADSSVAQLDVADVHSDNESNKIRESPFESAANRISDDDDESEAERILSSLHQMQDDGDTSTGNPSQRRQWLMFRPNTNNHPRIGSEFQAEI